jgi:hypothetical protein
MGYVERSLIKTEGAPAVTIHRVPLSQLSSDGLACLSEDRAIVSGQVIE